MSKVIWLPQALNDADRLFLFLKDKSLTAANKSAKTIKDGAEILSTFPEIGQSMNDSTDRRELFIPFGRYGYILRYVVRGELVLIIRAKHSKEDPDT
ncbi:type II toxin-antitoxin system RelE/ParE family toxin [Methylovulum psychrotolerans]|uniref:type II toxin-antitoxin system RelE/ParE family toxin n=1 Tax=Methylovulum psychrotolerans TaxID=1704499 RepID=UPI001BFF6D35|nr:type II toxin-antitoxin system RelE/ParE family toxin [Methylovulum psychrotolerans]